MGGALVERRAWDVVLTPLGRDVLAHVDDVLGAAERLERVARDKTAGHRSLSLGLIPTLAPYLLPGVLAMLRAGDLSLNVRIRESRTTQLLAGLQSGQLDAAVLALPSGGTGLQEVALFQDHFLLAGSHARLQQLDRETTVHSPRDLRASHLLLLEDGHCLSDQALEVCGMDRTASGINMGASSLATLSRLVAEGFGLTLMPELAACAEVSSVPGLRLRRFAAPEPARTIGLVRRASTQGDDWFEELAEVIRTVGQGIVAQCQRDFRPGLAGPETDDQAATSRNASTR